MSADRTPEHETRRRRLVVGGALLALVAVILVAVLLAASGDDEPAETQPASRLDGIPQEGPWLGRPSAPVVVEEYADLQCPFCAEFATDQLPPIIDARVRTGQVRIRFRTLTFLGEDSVEAGRFAVAAGLQNRQWQFTEALYADQGPENSGYVTESFLREVAEQAGVDYDRARRDSTSGRVAQALAASQQAADRAGVQSTPAFLVGRRGGRMRMAGADDLARRIEEAVGGS